MAASSSLLALPGASSLAFTTLPTTRTPLEPKKPNSSFCLKARCSNSSLAQQSAESKSTSAPAATIMSCSRRELLSAAMAALGGAVVASPPQAEAAASGQATCGTYNVSPSGLAYCDSSVGQGVAASKGLLIKAHYSGRLENGVEFDSSYKRGKPLTFRVGVGEVIRGWDQGILGTEGIPPMQAGGKRTLKIPANLGYGERGAGCRLGYLVDVGTDHIYLPIKSDLDVVVIKFTTELPTHFVGIMSKCAY